MDANPAESACVCGRLVIACECASRAGANWVLFKFRITLWPLYSGTQNGARLGLMYGGQQHMWVVGVPFGVLSAVPLGRALVRAGVLRGANCGHEWSWRLQWCCSSHLSISMDGVGEPRALYEQPLWVFQGQLRLPVAASCSMCNSLESS